MAGLCKATIIGNLGGDPEMRYTPAGRAFTTFNVACNRTYTTPEGERREETEWFRVTAWSRLAELCNQFLSKGRRVYIEGRLSSRSWEGADGQKRFSLEIPRARWCCSTHVRVPSPATRTAVLKRPRTTWIRSHFRLHQVRWNRLDPLQRR